MVLEEAGDAASRLTDASTLQTPTGQIPGPCGVAPEGE